MDIPQPVINTFNRVGIDYSDADNTDQVVVENRFGFGSCKTTPFIARLVAWVYDTSNEYEEGNQTVKVSDFDRIRYFIAKVAPEVYSTCID